jgi:hypothetical protein
MFSPNGDPEQRLREWRELRYRDHKSPQEVVQEFASLKPQQRYIDYYTPANWPNPFDIVREGAFDVSGISLIVAATLAHKGFVNTDQLRFDVISSHIDGSMGLYFTDETEYFNFVPGEVNTLQFVRDNGTLFESHIITYDQLMK